MNWLNRTEIFLKHFGIYVRSIPIQPSWILTLIKHICLLLLEERNYTMLATSWIFEYPRWRTALVSLSFNISKTKHVLNGYYSSKLVTDNAKKYTLLYPFSTLLEAVNQKLK